MKPQIKAARKAIAACRERGDGVLDLGGFGLNETILKELLPEIIDLPPLRALDLGVSGEAASQSTDLTADAKKQKTNALRSVPSELLEAHNQLKFLNLRHNQLVALPEAIGGLAELEYLALSDNQFEALPKAIGGLGALQTLLLDNNKLKLLPEAIGRLSALQNLSLFNNQLARISHQGDDGERLCSNRAFSGLCWRSIDAIKRRFGRTGV